MNTADRTVRPSLAAPLLLIAVLAISACQPVVHFIAHAGGEENLVWPLPPAAARLRYEASFDLVQGMSPALQTISGQDIVPSLRQQPLRVSARGFTIVTVERERGTVQVYKKSGIGSYVLRTQTGEVLQGALDAVIDEFDRIYVSQGSPAQVSMYDETGEFIRSFGVDRIWKKPARLALDQLRGRLYIADTFMERIFVFSLDGAFLFEFGEGGSKLGQFSGLSDLVVDHYGNLWILESGNRRIQYIRPGGRKMQILELDPATIVEPVSLAREPDGTLYVTDRYQESLVVLSPEGKFITRIGGLGREPGRFSGISDVSFNPDTYRLYTSEVGFPRIQMFRRTIVPWQPFP